MQRLKSSIAKKPLCFIIAILLIISVIGNLYLVKKVLNYENHKLVGTYTTNPEQYPLDAEKSEYIAFFTDKGTYIRYMQFEILEEGSYEAEYSRAYTLTSKDGTKSQIICIGKTIYRVADDNKVMCYEQFAKIPTFINVHPEFDTSQ